MTHHNRNAISPPTVLYRLSSPRRDADDGQPPDSNNDLSQSGVEDQAVCSKGRSFCYFEELG